MVIWVSANQFFHTLFVHAISSSSLIIFESSFVFSSVMIDEYDFDFAPGMTNPYIPQELLEKDAFYEAKEKQQQQQAPRAMLLDNTDDEEEEEVWRPFNKGGYMDIDKDEIVEFNDDGGWDLLEEEFDLSPEFMDGDEVWTS